MNTQSSSHQPDFRLFLKEELAQRCKKNPAYSLRAFAKLVGLSHPTLSQVLSGKRPLSRKAMLKIVDALSLSPDQVIQFQISREITFEEQFSPLQVNDFEIQGDWIHDAILELTHLKCFQPRAPWIAKVLEINIHQVNAATDRLQRAGLLKIDRKRKWTDLSANNTNNHMGSVNHAALKKYQKDLLQKSAEALESLPREERDHTSLMLKFSKKNIPEAKRLIKEFRTKFSSEAGPKNKAASDVYSLTISFFPISKMEKKI